MPTTNENGGTMAAVTAVIRLEVRRLLLVKDHDVVEGYALRGITDFVQRGCLAIFRHYVSEHANHAAAFLIDHHPRVGID